MQKLLLKNKFGNFVTNKRIDFLLKNNNNNNLLKYLKFSPTYKTKKYNLLEEEIKNEKIKENVKEEITKIKPVRNINYSYPIILTSPVLLSVSFLFFHGTFINSDLPELMKFIYKSTFLYGSLVTGLTLGIRIQEDEKFMTSTYNDVKKRFFYLCGILGISQSLAVLGLPFPIFMGLYGIMYALLNELMNNIHEELDDIFYQTKIILLVVGLINLIFISIKYQDYRNSLNDANNFENFFYNFYSNNDDKFENDIIEKEKCLRSIDYRLFKKTTSDI